MNETILKFYADKNLQVDKMIAKRPAGIAPVQVEAAAIQLYEEITSGKVVLKDIEIAWRVWEIARTINSTEYEERVGKLLGHEEITDALQAQNRRLKLWFWGVIAFNNWTWAAWLFFTW